MKLLILSDTHHANRRAGEIIEQVQPDRILHLGDCVSDFKRLTARFPDIPMLNVAGNCDAELDVPDSRIFELEGYRIFMTHGHIYNVKYNTMRLVYAAKELEAALVLFGHTHRAVHFEEYGMQILNPGAAVNGDYAIAELRPEGITCTLHSLKESDTLCC